MNGDAVEVASGGRRLRARPPWEPAGGGRDVLEIVIDPGDLSTPDASTQLCLELLLELDPEGGLCDWGAGSGILAIAAARLGFAPVEAVELAETGPETIRRNAAANGVTVRATRLDLAATPPPAAPTVTANLPLDVLQAIAAGPLERPPQRIIAAGAPDAVATAFARHGLEEAERRVLGDATAVRLTRSTSSTSTRVRA